MANVSTAHRADVGRGIAPPKSTARSWPIPAKLRGIGGLLLPVRQQGWSIGSAGAREIGTLKATRHAGTASGAESLAVKLSNRAANLVLSAKGSSQARSQWLV